MPTMDVSTPPHFVDFGGTSIGILSVGYAGNSNDFRGIRYGRVNSSTVLRVLIRTCSSTGVLEYFRTVE